MGPVVKTLCLKCRVWLASLVAQMVKNLPAVQETQVQSLGREDPLEKEMAMTGEFHGQRSLAGYSAKGHNILHPSW